MKYENKLINNIQITVKHLFFKIKSKKYLQIFFLLGNDLVKSFS